MEATREVYCEDAVTWMQSHTAIPGASTVASLPDISEFNNTSLEDWKKWFVNTAALVMACADPNCVSVFYQSDIKLDGVWVDKGFLIQQAALLQGVELLWHKIVCRSPLDTITHGRPAYSHLLCFSKNLRISDYSRATADVIYDESDKTWVRGMGLETCKKVVNFIMSHTETKVLLNPFCGEGAVLAVANSLGLNVVGIERSPKRANKARRQKVSANGQSWFLENEV